MPASPRAALKSTQRQFALPPDFVPHAAQLKQAWLASVDFQLHPAFDPDRDQAVYSLDANHEISVSEDDESSAVILVSLILEWSPPDSETPAKDFEPPFNLSISMGGAFEWPEGRPVETRRTWTEYNGMYLVWPYLRAQVSAIVTASGLPGFMLPTLVVPRPEEWEDSTPATHDTPAG